jgi:hypothetical protein
MKLIATVVTTLLLSVVAVAQKKPPQPKDDPHTVVFKCTDAESQSMFYKIFTTKDESKVGERVLLSLTIDEITSWRIPMHATDITESTVTYESRNNALADIHNNKPNPGRLTLKVNWRNEYSAAFRVIYPHSMKDVIDSGKCNHDSN